MDFKDWLLEVDDVRDPVYIFNIGDIHYGSVGFDGTCLDRDIDRILKTPNCVAFLTGDLTSGIGLKDKRFDGSATDLIELIASGNAPKSRVDMRRLIGDLYSTEARGAAEKVKALKPICPYLLSGNHEEAVSKHYQYHPSEEISRVTGIPFIGYSGICRIRVKDKKRKTAEYSIMVYTHHGFGGGRSKGAKINRVSQQLIRMAPINADVVLSAHVHDRSVWVEDFIEVTERGEMTVMPRQRGFAINGPYQKTYDRGVSSYGEIAAYSLANLGAVYLIVQAGYAKCETESGGKHSRLIKRIYDQPLQPGAGMPRT